MSSSVACFVVETWRISPSGRVEARRRWTLQNVGDAPADVSQIRKETLYPSLLSPDLSVRSITAADTGESLLLPSPAAPLPGGPEMTIGWAIPKGQIPADGHFTALLEYSFTSNPLVFEHQFAPIPRTSYELTIQAPADIRDYFVDAKIEQGFPASIEDGVVSFGPRPAQVNLPFRMKLSLKSPQFQVPGALAIGFKAAEKYLSRDTPEVHSAQGMGQDE